MGFRTLEISRAAEIHIKEGQLEITTEDGTNLSILSQNKVALMTLDEKYLPTAIVLPFEGHSRQSKLMHAQVHTSNEKYIALWVCRCTKCHSQKIGSNGISSDIRNTSRQPTKRV